MTKKIILSFTAAVITATSIFLIPSLASAQTTPSTVPSTTTGSGLNCTGGDCASKGLDDIAGAFPEGAKRSKSVGEIAKLIIDWALYLSAIIAVIFIIIGGFLYITSAGDPGKATKGRQTLINALIGLAIVVLSYIIVQVLYNFLINKS